jgi:Cdc6-like AAA superfamily ATPase
MHPDAEFPRPQTDQDWILLEFDIRALFTPSGPIDEEQLFAGRQFQIRQLLEAAIERSRHAVLFGERGVGKTSLANIFWKRFSKRLQTIVAARVQADPSDDFSSLWSKALRELRAVGDSIGRGDLVPVSGDHALLTPDDVRIELQKCRPNALPIIIIDEFDKLEERQTVELTANTIKSLSDYGLNCTIVIVGVAENLSDLIDQHESIRRCLIQIPLERMNNKELREVVDSRLKQTPMTIEEPALAKVVMLARGLPFYVHTIARYAALSATDNRRLSINEADVDKAMDFFINETTQTFYDAYQQATFTPQPGNLFKQVLLGCAIAETDENGFFSPTNVIPALSRILDREVTVANFQRHLSEFISEGRGSILVRRGTERQYRFRFRDPMMQPYVIMKGIREGMIDEKTGAELSASSEPPLPL